MLLSATIVEKTIAMEPMHSCPATRAIQKELKPHATTQAFGQGKFQVEPPHCRIDVNAARHG
jgi:hypothetical protein